MKVFNIKKLTNITGFAGVGTGGCVFTGTYNEIDIVIKIQSDEFEKIKDEVFYNDLVQHASPNFLAFYAAGSVSGESIKVLVENYIPAKNEDEDDTRYEDCVRILETPITSVMVMENAGNEGTLQTWIYNNLVTGEQIKKIMYQLVLSVYIMHTRYGLQHNDLKESNVLVKTHNNDSNLDYQIEGDRFTIPLAPGDPHVFIIDFGSADTSVDNDHNTGGTGGYMPIELLIHNVFLKDRGPEGDIFALGIMMLTMLANKRYEKTWNKKEYTFANDGDSVVWADITNMPLKDQVTEFQAKGTVYKDLSKKAAINGKQTLAKYMLMRFFWLQKELGTGQPDINSDVGKRSSIKTLFTKVHANKKLANFNPFEKLRETIIDTVEVPGLELLRLFLAWSPEVRLRFGSKASQWGLFNALFHPFFSGYYVSAQGAVGKTLYNPPLIIALDNQIKRDYVAAIEEVRTETDDLAKDVAEARGETEKEELKKAEAAQKQVQKEVVKLTKELEKAEVEEEAEKEDVFTETKELKEAQETVDVLEEELEEKKEELKEVTKIVEKGVQNVSIEEDIKSWETYIDATLFSMKNMKNKGGKLLVKWINDIKTSAEEYMKSTPGADQLFAELEIYPKDAKSGLFRWAIKNDLVKSKTKKGQVQNFAALQIIAGNVILGKLNVEGGWDMADLLNTDKIDPVDIVAAIEKYSIKQESTQPEHVPTVVEKKRKKEEENDFKKETVEKITKLIIKLVKTVSLTKKPDDAKKGWKTVDQDWLRANVTGVFDELARIMNDDDFPQDVKDAIKKGWKGDEVKPLELKGWKGDEIGIATIDPLTPKTTFVFGVKGGTFNLISTAQKLTFKNAERRKRLGYVIRVLKSGKFSLSDITRSIVGHVIFMLFIQDVFRGKDTERFSEDLKMITETKSKPKNAKTKYVEILKKYGLTFKKKKIDLVLVKAHLETIEMGKYLVDGQYDVVAIDKELISPLIDVLKIHDKALNDNTTIAAFLRSTQLYNTVNNRQTYVNTMAPHIQTKYYHSLSIVADIAMHADSGINDELVERCSVEWPALLLK